MTASPWTREHLLEAYPQLLEVPRSLGQITGPVRSEDVPSEFRHLIHYAELWGLGDDGARDGLVERAPFVVLENLVALIMPLDALLDPWLAGPEADGPHFSKAYIAFSGLRMAADYGDAILRQQMRESGKSPPTAR